MNSAALTRIQVLPTWLANKIAAGEVIERTASCVKELIENSLDAGATDIQVTVKEGGKKLIRISDNGHGILAGDLSLIFKSHSTSKIIEEKDLYNINTFGFRGEALASMASIAQVRLISKSASQQDTYEISVDNNKISQPQPAAGINGTTIEIANLFYQTPARRKFLKSNSVELSHITETITRFAIAYPEISFKLMHLPDNSSDADSPASARQSLINLTSNKDNLAQGILQRLDFFYGPDISRELLCATEEKDGLKLTAYFSAPTQTRSNSKYQFFYLNRRFIRDRILSRAIYQAYHNLIPSGRHPFVTLFIQMPTSAFDVNVHPTKIEVRFRDAWKIHDRIISLIRKTLSQKVSNGEMTVIETVPHQSETNENQRVMQALVDFFINKNDNNQETVEQPFAFSPSCPQIPPMTGKTSTSPTADSPRPYETAANITNLTSPLQTLATESLTTGRCFQIHSSYIIEEVPDGILIIDQHALHERILYNRFSQQIASSEIYRQKFLIPTVIEIPKSKSMILPEVIPYLKKAGIEVEEFGENTIAVQSAPSLLNNVNFTEFILEFIDAFTDDFTEGSQTKTEHSENIKPIEKLIKMMACKAAIKAGDPLKDEEIKALLADAKGMDFITCPHGRPAVRKITTSELEGYFQR